MEAKDTVLQAKDTPDYFGSISNLLNKQAEVTWAIALKEGRREVVEFIQNYIDNKGLVVEKYTSKPHYVATEWQPMVALLDIVARQAQKEKWL